MVVLNRRQVWKLHNPLKAVFAIFPEVLRFTKYPDSYCMFILTILLDGMVISFLIDNLYLNLESLLIS